MSRGLLLSFDGVDSSGKETQTEVLKERLSKAGIPTLSFQTPDYNLPSGQELKKLLQNSSIWAKKTWREKMRLFADNRAEHRVEVMDALNEGYIVIYDRYVVSSLAFITMEALKIGEVAAERPAIHAEITRYEYQQNHMPHEDVSIFLDVPPLKATQLLKARQKNRQDKNEYTDHVELQEALYKEYEFLMNNDPKRFMRVLCWKYERLRGINDIAEEIWHKLKERFSTSSVWGT